MKKLALLALVVQIFLLSSLWGADEPSTLGLLKSDVLKEHIISFSDPIFNLYTLTDDQEIKVESWSSGFLANGKRAMICKFHASPTPAAFTNLYFTGYVAIPDDPLTVSEFWDIARSEPLAKEINESFYFIPSTYNGYFWLPSGRVLQYVEDRIGPVVFAEMEIFDSRGKGIWEKSTCSMLLENGNYAYIEILGNPGNTYASDLALSSMIIEN